MSMLFILYVQYYSIRVHKLSPEIPAAVHYSQIWSLKSCCIAW